MLLVVMLCLAHKIQDRLRTTGRACSPPWATAVRLIAPKFVAPYRMSGVRGKNDSEPGHKQSR